MTGLLEEGLVVAAALCAAVSGSIFAHLLLGRKITAQRKDLIKDVAGSLSQQEVSHVLLESKGLSAQTILFILDCSARTDEIVKKPVIRGLWGLGLGSWEDAVLKAGLNEVVTKDGIVASRFVLSLIVCAGGLLIGWCFSEFLGVLLGFVGFVGGYLQPMKSIKQEAKERVYSGEKQLSEMLEVIILGLQSGLSFDKSLDFYCLHFSGSLARLMNSAHYQWDFGLVSRSEGLRNVAASYDSTLFERTFESIIRSLRFGTSLSESLHIASSEARAIRRSKLEERVAKAPVKMLLPVGALILPAMLVLIVGPILLELINGF